MKQKSWCVYLLKCLDGSYYTGITNNLNKRLESHKKGTGSKYVNAKGFDCLIASKEVLNKSDALKTEYKIKQLSKERKLDFFK